MAIDLNNVRVGGLPSANEAKAIQEERLKQRAVELAGIEAHAASHVAKKVDRLEDELKAIRKLLEMSVRISERQVIAINTLIPPEHSVISISSKEVQARQRMGFGVFEKLTEQSVKGKFRLLAKKCHPDVAGDESRGIYESLESDRDLLLQLIQSSGTT